MSVLPLTFLEKRWAGIGSGSNELHTAAATSTNRKSTPNLNRDNHRNLSAMGRQTMVSLGRKLYTDNDVVRGTVNDMADIATASLQDQYWGDDKAWGEQAEALLEEHNEICDVRGAPYSMRQWCSQLVISHFRDGDVGTILTQNGDGYPFFQVIPAHRIGNQAAFGSKIVEQGPWKGLRYIDGVIYNGHMRAVAFRIHAESANWGSGAAFRGVRTDDDDGNPILFQVRDMDGNEIYTEVSSRNMMLAYLPCWPDQARGIPELGTIAFSMQDVQESRSLDLLGGKLFAARQFVEYNETGEGNETQRVMDRGTVSTTDTDGTETLTSYRTESINGLEVTYFQAKSGSRIEAVTDARPSSNRQEFEDRIVRSALYALGWSFDFAYNPTKVGGAPMRVVVDRINRRARTLLNNLIIPNRVRFNRYRIAKFIKLGLLPPNADWWKWTVGGYSKITADAKYDADVAVMEMAAGIKTQQQCTAERSAYWEDVDAQKELEADAKLTRATRLSQKHGVSMDVSLQLMGFASKTGNLPSSSSVTKEDQENATGDDGDTEDTTQDSVNFKAEADAYGVAVRAGALTPTSDDEAHFRAKAGLPTMNKDVKRAWSDDKNVRRPITLVQAGGAKPTQANNSGEEDEETSDT